MNILKGLKHWFLFDIVQGLSQTLKVFFQPKVTISYPESIVPRSPRFRGLHALRRDDLGQERCVACQLCEAACPAMAIEVEPMESQNGDRVAAYYRIDLFKCIYCGLCEESCPVGAIVETDQIHYAFTTKGSHILNKETLLAIGDLYEKDIAKNRELIKMGEG